MTRPEGARPAPARVRPAHLRSQASRKGAPPKLNSEGYPLARCEFCRESIIWAREMDNPRARTPEGKIGKLVPIDPEPVTEQRAVLALSPPSGKDYLGKPCPQPRVGELRLNQAVAFRAAGKKTYIRHVKTCTHADELRRGVVRRHIKR